MNDDQQQFCLRWNDFQTNMVASFKHLRDEKSFTDVTIACDGQSTKAHKMILSACSPYFKALLEENPAKHPIIILKDVPFQHLTAILEFMYAGEVNVAQDQLPQFLKTAERLKVKGLAEAPQSVKNEWKVSHIYFRLCLTSAAFLLLFYLPAFKQLPFKLRVVSLVFFAYYFFLFFLKLFTYIKVVLTHYVFSVS